MSAVSSTILEALTCALLGAGLLYGVQKLWAKYHPVETPEEAKQIVTKTQEAAQADAQIVQNNTKIEAVKQQLVDDDKTPVPGQKTTEGMTDEQVEDELRRRGDLPPKP